MDIFTNSIPLWISVLFLISFIIPIFMIANVVRQAVVQTRFNNNNKVKILPGAVLLFFGFYYLYVMLMSVTGFFQVNTLPPRILLFTAIPLIIFYFLFVFRTKLFWQILENVKLSSLVRIHIFRLVGIFFIIGWYYGILPKSFAFIGGIGDIFAALTAIFVSRLIDQKTNNYKKITLIWNIFGFGDIVSVIISAVYITKQAIENNTQGILEMTKFPFCLIPAFAPATIIFLHICIFKKLKMEK
jgi:hypothetical protein